MDFEWGQPDKASVEKKRWDARAEELAKEAGLTNEDKWMAVTGTATSMEVMEVMEVEEIARNIIESLTMPGFTMHSNDYINFSKYDNGMSPEECFDELERGNKLGPYAEDAESEERKGGVKG